MLLFVKAQAEKRQLQLSQAGRAGKEPRIQDQCENFESDARAMHAIATLSIGMVYPSIKQCLRSLHFFHFIQPDPDSQIAHTRISEANEANKANLQNL